MLVWVQSKVACRSADNDNLLNILQSIPFEQNTLRREGLGRRVVRWDEWVNLHSSPFFSQNI